MAPGLTLYLRLDPVPWTCALQAHIEQWLEVSSTLEHAAMPWICGARVLDEQVGGHGCWMNR